MQNENYFDFIDGVVNEEPSNLITGNDIMSENPDNDLTKNGDDSEMLSDTPTESVFDFEFFGGKIKIVTNVTTGQDDTAIKGIAENADFQDEISGKSFVTDRDFTNKNELNLYGEDYEIF